MPNQSEKVCAVCGKAKATCSNCKNEAPELYRHGHPIPQPKEESSPMPPYTPEKVYSYTPSDFEKARVIVNVSMSGNWQREQVMKDFAQALSDLRLEMVRKVEEGVPERRMGCSGPVECKDNPETHPHRLGIDGFNDCRSQVLKILKGEV